MNAVGDRIDAMSPNETFCANEDRTAVMRDEDGPSAASAASVAAAAKTDVKILFLDDEFLVASKPPDVYINHDDPNVDSLAEKLKRLQPSAVDATVTHGFRFVHRLDFATSGAICLALTPGAAKRAGKAFEERRVTKHYLALLRGELTTSPLTVTYPIGADTRHGHEHKMTTPEMDAGCAYARHAKTRFHALARGRFRREEDEEEATLVLVQLETGRRHQIRVHALAIGHPIVGDFTYGSDASTSRMFLHSFRLRIPRDERDAVDVADESFETSLTQDWTETEGWESARSLSDRLL